MRLYQVTARADGAPARTAWVGSESDAARTRAALTADGFHRKDVSTLFVDVPTDKVGLIAFLNKQAVAAKAP